VGFFYFMILNFELPDEVILDLAAQLQAQAQPAIDEEEHKSLKIEIRRLTRETVITQSDIDKVGTTLD